MHSLQFKHVFAALMAMSLFSAFVLPKRLSDHARAQLQVLFAPVSRPVRSVGLSLHQRLNPPDTADHEGAAGRSRTAQQIIDENQQLRTELASLTTQLHALRELNADRQLLGQVRPWCRPLQVVGGDAGQRQSLSLQGQTEGMARNMAVLGPGGIVGRIDRAAWSGGAQVQLISDKGFGPFTVRFARFVSRGGTVQFQALPGLSGLARGDGAGGLIVPDMPVETIRAAGLQAHDWVVLADTDGWPDILQGYRVGQVGAIVPSRAALHCEIQIRPARSLTDLREVWVLVK